MKNLIKICICFVLLAATSSCKTEIQNHGYIIDESKFSLLREGATAQQVKELLGTPSSITKTKEVKWYYMGSKVEVESFYEKNVTEYDSYIITFSDDMKIKEIHHNDVNMLNDNIELAKEKTQTGGNKVTVWQQFLGNLGRYSPAGDGRVSSQ